MSEEIQDSAEDLQQRWLDLSARSAEIMQKFMSQHDNLKGDAINFDPFNLSDVFLKLSQSMMKDPSTFMKMQMQWWQGSMQLWQDSMARLNGQEPNNSGTKDRRFKDEAWESHAVYNYMKESYLLSSRLLLSAVEEAQGLDEDERHRLTFYTKQFTDALSPTNFAFTNPEVMRATYESGGENLVNGLENLLEDLQMSEGQMRISMTDESAFEIGDNLATTEGTVVYQNDLMQLIQYKPLTEQVCEIPLLVIPPWINKFYILDLTEKNSFIRYLVSQGFTVFIISWVNPDEKLRNKDFDNYMLEGPLEAISAICKQTDSAKVNVLGYCIGGTLLASTLAYMAEKKDNRVASATYLTTMLDFENAGDLKVFIDEQQLKKLEDRMDEIGYLQGEEMAQTFNMLRANDLIWSFVVNNYLLGKDPMPFDLLYWNSDSTRMPAAMHSSYLRQMYLENRLKDAGGITLDGVSIDLGKIKVPSFVLSTREDHIAPWEATYAANHLFKGDVKFVLAGSGHIAGVVNPPAKNKYGYWTNEKSAKTPEKWLESAEQHEGSWWPAWCEWLKTFSGKQVPARDDAKGKLKAIEAAPGSYVKMRF